MKILSTPLSNTLPNADLTSTARAQRSEVNATDSTAVTTSDMEEGFYFADASATDIDMDRVAQVRQAIEDGTFQSSAVRISQGLAQSVMETHKDVSE